MTLRLALILALIGSLEGRDTSGAPVLAQEPDGVRTLLQRLERVVHGGNAQAYLDLVSGTADRQAAAAFAAGEIVPGVTRVALHEREREPLIGTLPGNGYRLSVDVFVEFGARARSVTWRLDVRRLGDDAWRIADQQRLAVVENLYRLSLTPDKQFDARDLTIAVEDLDLTLFEGSAFLIEIDQGITGLVWLGRGELRFHPAPEVEKSQLKIFSGSPILRSRVDAAYLRMHPHDVEALVKMDRLTPRPVDPGRFRRADDVFREQAAKSYAVDMSDLSRDLWSLVPASGDFLAEMRTQRYDTLTYARSGSEAEDLSFFDRKRRKNIAVYASRRSLERRGPFYNEDDFVAYDVLDYDIDVAVSPDRLWFDGRARLQLRVQAAALSSLTLRLAEPLVVQSVVSDRFGRLLSVRVRNQNAVIVNLPSALLRDDELTLTVAYVGRLEPQREDAEAGAAPSQTPPAQAPAADDLLIVQAERSYLYSNRSYWYPQATVTDYATARIRVTVPGGFDCVASGELSPGYPMAAVAAAGQARKVYEFTTSRHLRYLAFVISRFAHSEPLALQFDSGASLNLSVLANPRQVRRGRELAERAREIVQFYESILQDCPYPSFTLAVVESDLPGGHSPGYFATLNQPLPTSPYVWRNDPAAFDDFPEFFLAHELAHQWWGQAVGWRNYHEQWLSEGFAQYFAALYAGHRRGNDALAKMLRQFRRWAMRQSGQGPVYLGYRLGHIRNNSRVYRALVYNKSAAVLHMLRRLVGDDAFFRGMRRFYDASRFRKAGTDNFRAAMEAESGRWLKRFFDQWIYGSTLPRVRVDYRVEAGAHGPQLVLRVEQLAEVFDVPLTVTLRYADDRAVDVIVPVTERTVEVPVPLEGVLKTIDVREDDGTLADIVR